MNPARNTSKAVNRSRRSALNWLGGLGLSGVLAMAAPRHSLAQAASPVPEVLDTRHVQAISSVWEGSPCLAVELTDAQQALTLKTGGNGPTYAIVRRKFSDGIIEVDVAAELTGKGGADARGFAGVAFHAGTEPDVYEAVYLRMSNGRQNDPRPPAPRIDRAIQYVAHPDFHYYVSREKSPGRYERGADIALGRWHRLRLEIFGSRVRALVDGREVLAVDDLRYAGRSGDVGLWIDDGSRGYFRQLRISDATDG